MKRLVVGTNWIGDAVMSLPFLRALRAAHPGDSLTRLRAGEAPPSIYRAEGTADEVLVRSGFLRDVAVLASATVRRGLAAAQLVSGGALRAGLAALRGESATPPTGAGPLLTRSRCPRRRPPGHQLRDYDALLAAHGIPPDSEPPRLPDSREAAAAGGQGPRAPPGLRVP